MKIRGNVCLFTTRKFHTACVANVDIYTVPIGEIDKPVDQVFPFFEERKLICYCDGSYSHIMQIGLSGFRTSNGVYQVRFFSFLVIQKMVVPMQKSLPHILPLNMH